MEFVRVYLRSLRLLRSEASLTFVLVLAGIGVAAVQLLEPILFGHVVDGLSTHVDFLHYLMLWAALGISSALANVFLATVADRLAHRHRMAVMNDVFARIIALPVGFHAKSGSGKIVRTILAGTDQLFGLWLSLFREHLSAFVGITLLVPTALFMDRRMAGLLFALATVYAVANWLIIRRTHGRQAQVEVHFQNIAGRLVDVVGNVNIVQSYVRFREEKEALKSMAKNLLAAQYPVLNWWGVLNTITRISSMLTLMTIVGYGSILVARGEVTAGEVVTFAGFSNLLISRLDQLSSFMGRAVNQAPTLGNLFELIDAGPAERPPMIDSGLGPVRGEVEFRDVSFRYAPDSPGVFNLNFRVRPGQSVALVGPSGAGKTTCLALLQRMMDPQSGQILVDGQDITETSPDQLRRSIAAVFQDAGLFNRSIAENIRVGRAEATMAEVEHAARRAEAHEFIEARPEGYDFPVGERGLALSGGERQRVAIARAILKDAPILILDEATSALDNETEKKIQLALEHLRETRTTFIIAHRLSTIVSSDLILVFDQGRIVEAGKFAELRLRNGLFRRLLDAGQLDESHGEAPLAAAEMRASI